MNFWWIIDGDTIGYNSTFQHTFDTIIGDTICYSVILIGQTKHGCIDSASMTICVIPDPIAQLNVDSIPMYCAPLQIDTLGIQAIPYINAQPNDSISWQVINSSGITVATATGLNCPSHVITDQNDYIWIVITATNICGSNQDSLQIWTSEDPVADFDINTTQGCHPLTITCLLYTSPSPRDRG